MSTKERSEITTYDVGGIKRTANTACVVDEYGFFITDVETTAAGDLVVTAGDGFAPPAEALTTLPSHPKHVVTRDTAEHTDDEHIDRDNEPAESCSDDSEPKTQEQLEYEAFLQEREDACHSALKARFTLQSDPVRRRQSRQEALDSPPVRPPHHAQGSPTLGSPSSCSKHVDPTRKLSVESSNISLPVGALDSPHHQSGEGNMMQYRGERRTACDLADSWWWANAVESVIAVYRQQHPASGTPTNKRHGTSAATPSHAAGAKFRETAFGKDSPKDSNKELKGEVKDGTDGCGSEGSGRAGSSPKSPSLRPARGHLSSTGTLGAEMLHCPQPNPRGGWVAFVLRTARRRVRQRPLTMPERRLAWPLFSGFCLRPDAEFSVHHGAGPASPFRDQYFALLAEPIPAALDEVMLRDLGRTLPTHCLFQRADSAGQKSLRRVLHAYCVLDPDVGYCQGMGFLAAVLLLHVDEPTTFGIFTQLMQGRQFSMRQLYQNGFPLLQRMFVILRHLLQVFLPRLHAHLAALNIDVAFFASHWFLTLFAYQFPVPLVARLWDLFLSEGWKVIFRTAIVLLQWDEGMLLQMRMEAVLMHLKSIHEGKDAEVLLRRVMALPIKERDLNQAVAAAQAAQGQAAHA